MLFARISGTLRLSRYSREVALLVNNLEAQERFASAAAKAAADMADPEKKAEWQAVADASHGKFKTARGAAFAVYYNQDVVE